MRNEMHIHGARRRCFRKGMDWEYWHVFFGCRYFYIVIFLRPVIYGIRAGMKRTICCRHFGQMDVVAKIWSAHWLHNGCPQVNLPPLFPETHKKPSLSWSKQTIHRPNQMGPLQKKMYFEDTCIGVEGESGWKLCRLYARSRSAS